LPAAPCIASSSRIYRETILRYVPHDIKDHPIVSHDPLVQLNDLVSEFAQVKFASPVVECERAGKPIVASRIDESCDSKTVDDACAVIADTWL
jgi:hypothetical protein